MSATSTSVFRGKEQGFLSKSVAGAVNVRLTTDEAQNTTISITGAITANIDLIFPFIAEDAGVAVRLENLTTGAFTVTAKGQSGSGIVLIQSPTAGFKTELVWNGTDFQRWSQQ